MKKSLTYALVALVLLIGLLVAAEMYKLSLTTQTNREDSNKGVPSVVLPAETPKQATTPVKSVVGECYVGGCSGQICSDEEGVASNCMYVQEYACYKSATCERQATGACGWTETSELASCLAGQ